MPNLPLQEQLKSKALTKVENVFFQLGKLSDDGKCRDLGVGGNFEVPLIGNNLSTNFSSPA